MALYFTKKVEAVKPPLEVKNVVVVKPPLEVKK